MMNQTPIEEYSSTSVRNYETVIQLLLLFTPSDKVHEVITH